MSFDPATFRRESAERWARAAGGWAANRAVFQAAVSPVSAWMIEAVEPQRGQRVLELAAGPADTGLMAAELTRPGGTLICTDIAEEMLDTARARAAELGLEDGVEFRVMDAEWIDLPTADVDAVLCRFGYMLLADPAAALRETRRVLRPRGRVALATWAAREHTPWLAVPGEELSRMTGESPDPSAPGPFALADREVLEDALGGAGFLETTIEQLDLTFAYEDLDTWWDVQLDLGANLRAGVTALDPAQRDELREAIDARLDEYVARDGSVRLPARTHVAVAGA
ncbi:MAG TPA: methyltransferase domain-containing protein [Solirubrobacteraceae bacterium]|nr:methyltransferase domain-containing protein [Solirubrobacteraceae bacterium]